MGSRTAELPPLTGISRLVREFRYQEAARQGIGLLLMPVYALLAHPVKRLFVAGVALAIIGTLVRVYASGYIVKNQQLATDGPYSLVRHPLYTGNLLLLIGFTLANACWWAPLVSVCFWWFYYPPAVEYEDRKLRRIFGEPCAAWQKSIPAVLPRSLLPSPGGRWSLRTSLTRNAEPVVVLYTLCWLAWIASRL